MRFFFALAVLCAATTASAEVRFINGTGQPLTVDVLHADKQERGIALPSGPALSKVYGAKLGANDQEMIVVYDGAGKELLRQEVQNNFVVVLNKSGSGVSAEYNTRFQGRVSEPKGFQIFNATGGMPTYKVELPDFSVRDTKGTTPKAGSVTTDSFSNLGDEGARVKTTIDVNGMSLVVPEMKLGGVYHLVKAGDALKIETIR